jgi:DNA polymerase-1
MQGTAADIIKLAMIGVDGWLREQQSDTCIIMQVHDELVFEVPENELSEMSGSLPARMSEAASLAVPLKVDTGIGDNWDEAH